MLMKNTHWITLLKGTFALVIIGLCVSSVAASDNAQPVTPGGSPPARPGIVAPVNGSENLMFPVVLRSSDFSDPDKDTHSESEWIVKVKRNGRVYIHTETSTTNKHTFALPVKHPGAVYEWQVRYKDSRGVWSELSPLSTFTTTN